MTAFLWVALVGGITQMLLDATVLAVMDFPVTQRITPARAMLRLLAAVGVATWASVLLFL